ncbi:hypothetical protein O0L34_g16137 [Tuta absoluta]|nr:hypothetical protein O0L34_g16137 [Tuta absoluta]
MWLFLKILIGLASGVISLNITDFRLLGDYFSYKNTKQSAIFSCDTPTNNTRLVKHLMRKGIRSSVRFGWETGNLDVFLQQWDSTIGVMLDASCNNTQQILDKSSKLDLFDNMHAWLVLNSADSGNNTVNIMDYIEAAFNNLNLSVDADIAVAFRNGDRYQLMDVFNFGRIQGNPLEKTELGVWRDDVGLNISLVGFKYYNRWDFHNLTLRAVSVILDRPKVFVPSMLEDIHYTPGVSAMTKIVAQLLNILKEQHNFRFNYSIVGRWVGAPQKNTTLAVTNSLYWKQQDISVTCLRIYPKWLEWVDPILPPATQLQTKCYYLIPEKGVGNYENRFLTPLSVGVWLCSACAALLCALVLFCSAAAERHPQPAMYAIGSVYAAVCQQAYEDGVILLEQAFSSQSRRLILLVIGMTSMLLYNYYTSSVVSWLLSAPPPTIANIDGLIHSNLELTFEDIGYTRQWLDSPKFYYYSGYVNPKEDELRETKVTKAKRTVGLLQSAEDGIELIRTGSYAYHSEPYTASQVIGRKFSERELCELGSLQIMQPSHVYIMAQKRSPYKQFFTWSLMRLLERGLTKACRARIDGTVPSCSGQTPRALALGQAAPAFALMMEMYCLATLILLCEILWHSSGSGSSKGLSNGKRLGDPDREL